MFNGDYVIITTSAPTSASIQFEPELSIMKRMALRTVSYTASTKVLMVFGSPFWQREHGKAKGGSTLTDLHIKQGQFELKFLSKQVPLLFLVLIYLDR